MSTRELYIVRHAIAEERGDEWPDDTKRPLTKRGMERFREVVRGLRAIGVAPEQILTSPLVRAAQTAAILASGLDGKPPVKTLGALAPGHAPATTLAQLGKATRAERLAVVGHEPDLGLLAAYLIGAEYPLVFRKGGVCRIDVTARGAKTRGSLIWFMTPKVLRELAR
jgi:phosphohistidine phosphatase